MSVGVVKALRQASQAFLNKETLEQAARAAKEVRTVLTQALLKAHDMLPGPKAGAAAPGAANDADAPPTQATP